MIKIECGLKTWSPSQAGRFSATNTPHVFISQHLNAEGGDYLVVTYNDKSFTVSLDELAAAVNSFEVAVTAARRMALESRK